MYLLVSMKKILFALALVMAVFGMLKMSMTGMPESDSRPALISKGGSGLGNGGRPRLPGT